MSTSVEVRRVSSFGRAVWGLGSLGTIGYLNTVTALVMLYLTTVVRLDPLVAGALVASARVFDAFTDPAMGLLSDRTHTRWGRRRPYLLLGAVICAIALPTLYAIPLGLPTGDRVLWTAAVLILYSIGFTVFNVPYMTMAVEMTTDSQERVSLMTYRVIFMMVGGFVGNAGAPWVVTVLGNNATAYAHMGLLFGVGIFVVMLLVFLCVPDRSVTGRAVAHVGFREQLRSAADNRPLMILLGVKVLQFIGIAANSATLAFFVTAVMKRDLRTLAFFGTVTLIANCVSVFGWRLLACRMSKKTGCIVGVIGFILGTLSWLASGPAESTSALAVRAIAMGVFGSSILLFEQAMLLDAVEHDRLRTGLERAGLFTSAYVFIERLGYSLGPLLLGGLLHLMDFDAKLPLDRQPPSASTAVILSLVGIPVITFGLSLVFLFRYDLTEERLEMLRGGGPHARGGRGAAELVVGAPLAPPGG
jgi:GPH family glycoside/pentoside/hexuronide:cation symporter